MVQVNEYTYRDNKFVRKKMYSKDVDCINCTFLSGSGKVCFYKGKISHRDGVCSNKETRK